MEQDLSKTDGLAAETGGYHALIHDRTSFELVPFLDADEAMPRHIVPVSDQEGKGRVRGLETRIWRQFSA